MRDEGYLLISTTELVVGFALGIVIFTSFFEEIEGSDAALSGGFTWRGRRDSLTGDQPSPFCGIGDARLVNHAVRGSMSTQRSLETRYKSFLWDLESR